MTNSSKTKVDEKHAVIEQIRSSYDAVASEYVRHVYDELRHKPLDREILSQFANDVRGLGTVCDMGCGPGHVTAFLYDAGIDVFGLDLSPKLIEQARQLNPTITFRDGDMLSLDIEGNSLAGIVSFYSIVNLPKGTLPSVFAEMYRVLQRDGRLLMAFHLGQEAITPEELWGVPITMDFFLFESNEISALLESAGFIVESVVKRSPYPDVEYQSERAYIRARRNG